MITPYLPHLSDLVGVAVTWGIGAILLLAGTAVVRPAEPPECRIAAGWGVLCLVLTGWGVFVPLSLRLPAIAFVCLALALQFVPNRRLVRGDLVTLGRMLAVSLPLWLIMAPIHPSQPDTFLNLLPNAVYLADYGRFPTAALPPSHSYLPAAPYNTQFLAFLGGLAIDDYAGAGMSLVNVMLQLVAGLAIARVLASDRPPAGGVPSWGLTALGFLLVTLLNPGFVPRIDFSAFGETALAVTAVLAAWMFVLHQQSMAREQPGGGLIALSLTLAAMVNAKQSAIGLVASLAGGALLAGWFEPAVSRGRLLRATALALVPAAFLYALWRYYVAHAGVAELVPLPWPDWNWSTIPGTIASAGKVIAEKPTYYSGVLVALVALPLLLQRRGWTTTTRFLAFHAAAFALYNGFLLLTYIVHFSEVMSADAHSYFRYSTHLSLVLVLALGLLARDLLAADWLARHRQRLAAAGLAVALAAPVAFVARLRFDLDMPQPLVWRLADRVKPLLADGDRLALLLPGDNGSLAAMLAVVLTDVAPRRRLDLTTRDNADPTTLDEMTRLGYRRALISCTAAGTAALVERDGDHWHEIAAWPYPADMTKRRWQSIISWRPLCRNS